MTSLKMESGILGVKNTAAVNMIAAVSPAARDSPRMER
jgi:ABC-type cobalamin transport system permease subunit